MNFITMDKIEDLIPNFNMVRRIVHKGGYRGASFGWYDEKGNFQNHADVFTCKEFLTAGILPPNNTTYVSLGSNPKLFHGSAKLLNRWEKRLKFPQLSEWLLFKDSPSITVIKIAPEWKQNPVTAAMFGLIIRGGLGWPTTKGILEWMKSKKTYVAGDSDHKRICLPYLARVYKKRTFFVGKTKEMNDYQLVTFCKTIFNPWLKERQEVALRTKRQIALKKIQPISQGELIPFLDDEAEHEKFIAKLRKSEINKLAISPWTKSSIKAFYKYAEEHGSLFFRAAFPGVEAIPRDQAPLLYKVKTGRVVTFYTGRPSNSPNNVTKYEIALATDGWRILTVEPVQDMLIHNNPIEYEG